MFCQAINDFSSHLVTRYANLISEKFLLLRKFVNNFTRQSADKILKEEVNPQLQPLSLLVTEANTDSVVARPLPQLREVNLEIYYNNDRETSRNTDFVLNAHRQEQMQIIKDVAILLDDIVAFVDSRDVSSKINNDGNTTEDSKFIIANHKSTLVRCKSVHLPDYRTKMLHSHSQLSRKQEPIYFGYNIDSSCRRRTKKFRSNDSSLFLLIDDTPPRWLSYSSLHCPPYESADHYKSMQQFTSVTN
ncbi:hypothetical protein GJ496_006531 [Pomphorhynchus laevis]|nr:hypothetical protein GJ496_006531 [Pomphorhynchus laevis]